ncbi:MAG TPA: hypothetical protein DCS30_06860 [Rhizobiales bacterium]|nr:hypothetical protein [Hyphomicrobiales bacterium]
MYIKGQTGLDGHLLDWTLWPKDGFTALQSLAVERGDIGQFLRSNDALSYWIEDPEYSTVREPNEMMPRYMNGIVFYGEDLVLSDEGALIGGTITGVERIFFGGFDAIGYPSTTALKELNWSVAEINADPTMFWEHIFDGNDQFVYSQSTLGSSVDLGDGDDSLEVFWPLNRYGGTIEVDMGAGDDFFRDATSWTTWSWAHPSSLILGEGFDDVEMGDEDNQSLRYVKDFNPEEDRVKFLDADETLTITQVEGGIEVHRIVHARGTDIPVGRIFFEGVSADQVKLENGYLTGKNGRDYSRHVNDLDVTQHLHGTTNKDVFVLDGKRDDYRWHATDDGKGIVIWDVKTETPDLLYDFEVLRFNDVSLQLSEWPTSEGPAVEGIRDIADQTQYLQAEEWGETFIIDGKMSDYQWAPTQDRTGTVVWNVKTGKHDILTDFAWINFNDGKADLVQYPRSNAPTTEDQVDKDEIIKADNHREVFEIDGYRDDYSWGPNPDGEGIAIWNGSNIDILIGFDGVRFLDSYADLRALPQWGDVPRPNGEILIKDDPTDNQYLRGETGEEIFVFDGNKGDYNWGPTRDGKGVVVWNKDGFDILMDFKAIRFNDDTITTNEIRGIDDGNVSGVKIKDIANETQYLHGEGDKDQFIIDGNAEDYAWGATRDETGFVVWNRETKVHDILTDFEEVVFNDQVLVVEDVI